MTTYLVPTFPSHHPMYYMDHLSTIAVILGTSLLVPLLESVIWAGSFEHPGLTASVSFNYCKFGNVSENLNFTNIGEFVTLLRIQDLVNNSETENSQSKSSDNFQIYSSFLLMQKCLVLYICQT